MKNTAQLLGKYLLFLIFLIDFSSTLNGLERNYTYNYTDLACDEYPDDHSDKLCLKCILWRYNYDYPFLNYNNLSSIPILPMKHRTYKNNRCYDCFDGDIVYSGYIHFIYGTGYPFLEKQISFTKKYPNSQAYWPETSDLAADISNLAVSLFKNLFCKTRLMDDFKYWYFENDNNSFLGYNQSWSFPNGLIIYPVDYPKSLCGTCFRFSDYYQVVKDFGACCRYHYNDRDYAIISDMLDEILEKLAPLFEEMYNESLSNEPTIEMQEEKDFLDFVSYNIFNIEFKLNGLISNKAAKLNFNSKSSYLPNWFLAQKLIVLGSHYNEYLLHDDALGVLNDAITLSPNNADAYIERAYAYFEKGNLDLAILDYTRAKKIFSEPPKPYFQKFHSINNNKSVEVNDIDFLFSQGYIQGICKGGKESFVDFIPEILSSCRGILHGLWAFACSPIDISRDFVSSTRSYIEYLRTLSLAELAENCIPELYEILDKWDSFSHYEQGYKAGYIVGKYGISVLIPVKSIKALSKFNQLKKSNTIITIESCINSTAKRDIIVKKSTEHSSIRARLCQTACQGKVVAQNANVIPHVLQEKHAWNKLIKLSGNQREDFKKVVEILENNRIFEGKKKTFEPFFSGVDNKKIVRHRYLLEVNGFQVEADFIEYVDLKEIYLNNAWVKIAS